MARRTAKYRMSAVGSSDLRIRLRPESETSWRRLLAGLSRAQFGVRACGENTMPPCDSVAAMETKNASAKTGAIHFAALRIVNAITGELLVQSPCRPASREWEK